MSDRNYKSYDGPQEDISHVILDPIGAGWAPGSWQDTCKFNRREGRTFSDFTIINGGTEDGIDASCRNEGNLFERFVVSAGDKYVLTLKGSSSCNTFMDWKITQPGKWVDIQIGNWHDDDPKSIDEGFSQWARSAANEFINIRRMDGKPVRYAYRFGCKPTFMVSDVKYLWWMSLGLSVYWLLKYAYVRIFK